MLKTFNKGMMHHTGTVIQMIMGPGQHVPLGTPVDVETDLEFS